MLSFHTLYLLIFYTSSIQYGHLAIEKYEGENPAQYLSYYLIFKDFPSNTFIPFLIFISFRGNVHPLSLFHALRLLGSQEYLFQREPISFPLTYSQELQETNSAKSYNVDTSIKCTKYIFQYEIACPF